MSKNRSSNTRFEKDFIRELKKRTGKKFIGVDINEKYVKISERRLEELGERPHVLKQKNAITTMQMELWVI